VAIVCPRLDCPLYCPLCCFWLQQVPIVFNLPPPTFNTTTCRLSDCLLLYFSLYQNYIYHSFPFHFSRIPLIVRFLNKNRVLESRLEQSGTECLLLAVFVLTEIWWNGGRRPTWPFLLCLQEERLERVRVHGGGADAVQLRVHVLKIG
jgi:hypothetical protein